MSKKSFSLRKTWQRVRTVPGLGRDVTALAALIVACIVSVLGVMSFLGGNYPWSDRFVLRAEFDQVPSLNPDASHYASIAGVSVGDITGWNPTAQGTAIVTMSIENTPETTIYRNASAVLRAENPLNEMFIDINPGSPQAGKLERNGLIPISRTDRPIQADEVLGHLDEQARKGITDLVVASNSALEGAPQQLPGGLRAVDRTLLDLRPAAQELQTRRAKISELVTALSQISAGIGANQERATRLAQATQETLGVLANNDQALESTLAQMPGLSSQLRNALTSTQGLTNQLDPTLRNLNAASEELPPALSRFEKTIEELDTVVDVGGPVIREARPVVADLRPLVGDVDTALDDALPVTANLDRDTGIIKSYLTPIRAFIYNTSSVFGVRDGNQAQIRGHFVAALPDGGLLPGGQRRNSPGAEGGLQPGTPDGPTPPPPGNDVPNQEGGNGGSTAQKTGNPLCVGDVLCGNPNQGQDGGN